MHQHAVADLDCHLGEILVRAVHRIARLERGDRRPAESGEPRARFGRRHEERAEPLAVGVSWTYHVNDNGVTYDKTTAVIATEDLEVARAIQKVVTRGLFRVYLNDDVVGDWRADGGRGGNAWPTQAGAGSAHGPGGGGGFIRRALPGGDSSARRRWA